MIASGGQTRACFNSHRLSSTIMGIMHRLTGAWACVLTEGASNSLCQQNATLVASALGKTEERSENTARRRLGREKSSAERTLGCLAYYAHPQRASEFHLFPVFLSVLLVCRILCEGDVLSRSICSRILSLSRTPQLKKSLFYPLSFKLFV